MTAQEYNDCVRQWSDGIYRFSIKNLRHTEDAKDIVQQSFEVLWVNREKVTLEKSKSYLFTIAYRKCIDWHRIRKRENEFLNNINDNETLHQHKNYDYKQYLQQALAQLDTQSRSLILLKDYEGYKNEEIASITELSLSQVKVYLHRARKQMKTYLTTNELK